MGREIVGEAEKLLISAEIGVNEKQQQSHRYDE